MQFNIHINSTISKSVSRICLNHRNHDSLDFYLHFPYTINLYLSWCIDKKNFEKEHILQVKTIDYQTKCWYTTVFKQVKAAENSRSYLLQMFVYFSHTAYDSSINIWIFYYEIPICTKYSLLSDNLLQKLFIWIWWFLSDSKLNRWWNEYDYLICTFYLASCIIIIVCWNTHRFGKIKLTIIFL